MKPLLHPALSLSFALLFSVSAAGPALAAERGKETAQAVQWFQKAAAQNHARAQYQLGMCHAVGQVFQETSWRP